jgi:hypothetical protein
MDCVSNKYKSRGGSFLRLEMKSTFKSILASILAALATLTVLLLSPYVSTTIDVYFDTNLGRKMEKHSSFGRVYLEKIEETKYSLFLRSLGFEDGPAEWKLAVKAERGLVPRIFGQSFPYYDYGRVAAQGELLALGMSWASPTFTNKIEIASHFRTLVRYGDLSGATEYFFKINSALKDAGLQER